MKRSSESLASQNCNEVSQVRTPISKKNALFWHSIRTQPWWETVWEFLKNLKLNLPYDPGISLLGIYRKENKSGYKGCQLTEQRIARWHTYTAELYSAKKRSEIPFLYTEWMQRGTVMLCGRSQSPKDKYHRFSLICGKHADQNVLQCIGKNWCFAIWLLFTALFFALRETSALRFVLAGFFIWWSIKLMPIK